jgi:REP element-mobilizing transposase RayT
MQSDMWAYMGGIANRHGIQPLAIGGTANHVHLLLALNSSVSVAEVMRTIKSVSTQWMHEVKGIRLFSWQQGYGAFSIGTSQLGATIAYIQGQEEHHRKRDFQQEFLAILKKHGIACDPRYVWG